MLNCYECVVLITGCDTGFGNMLAKQLDDLGVVVYACCYSDNGVNELRQQCSNRLNAVRMDVTKSVDIQRVYEMVENDGVKLTTLVNNAGIAKGFLTEFSSMQDYRDVMDVNFFGMVEMTKKFLPLLKQTQGRVINVTSVAGIVAAPTMGAYACSKFAAEAFTNCIRSEVERFNIKVIDIAPGFHRTPIVTESIARITERFGGDEQASLSSEYGDFKEKFNDKVRALAAKCADPQRVVDKLIHATLAENPRWKYWIGVDAQICRFLSCLPPWCIPKP